VEDSSSGYVTGEGIFVSEYHLKWGREVWHRPILILGRCSWNDKF